MKQLLRLLKIKLRRTIATPIITIYQGASAKVRNWSKPSPRLSVADAAWGRRKRLADEVRAREQSRRCCQRGTQPKTLVLLSDDALLSFFSPTYLKRS